MSLYFTQSQKRRLKFISSNLNQSLISIALNSGSILSEKQGVYDRMSAAFRKLLY